MSSISVMELSGIGPAIATRLNELGLFTTSDLLRSHRRRLAEAIHGASDTQVRQWQAVAELLEVNGLTLPLAEGLYQRGMETLDELAGSSIKRLRGIINDMRTAGNAGSDISDEDLVAWMKDALLLRLTGTLNGTVTGPGGSPLEGVTARCMGKVASTDAQGRFRIRRLPIGRRLVVHLEHPLCNLKTAQTDRVAPANVLISEQFRLTARRTPISPPRVLSELHGDQLPSISGTPITTRVQEGEPSKHDLLRIFEITDDGGARVASCLLDYDAGMHVVRTYRLKQSDVPAGSKVRDYLKFSAGMWQVADMKAACVAAYRRRLRALKLRPPLSPDATAAEVDRAMRDYMLARAAAREKSNKNKEII